METKPQTILEAAYNVLIGEGFTDTSTLDEFDSSDQILKMLRKDPTIKKHILKPDNLYFDDADLILFDKTVKSGLLSSDGWDYTVSIGDLKKMILKLPAIMGKAKPKADETVIGKFIVKLPKEFEGTLGTPNTPMKNPRAIVTATDKEAEMIKKLLHSPKENITVRIMKRSDGNKVYIDGKDNDNFKAAMEKLKKIK